MKALVPFNNMDSFEAYKNAGAGEVYIGFWDEAWHEAFGEYADLNRLTGYKDSANRYSFEEVLPIIRRVKESKIAIYVTFNSSIYSQEQLDFMERYMDPLHDAGVDGIIVSCPELIQIAKNHKINAIISTIAGIYNTDMARFYWRLGADRIILPRDLSPKDIEQIVDAVPDVEYEVFLMRNGCSFSDSNCLGLHRTEKSAICATLANAQDELFLARDDFHARHDMELNHLLFQSIFHSYACGLCSLYRFVKMGITAGKVVGRTDEWEEICEDIRLIKENVEIAKNCNSEKEYLERMKFPSRSRIMCKMGLNCYYPETRFWKL
ncbi:MAG: U32 family peptidase [Clostridium sp.]|nr:U32 family peptidase [Clostridium sp.]